MDKVLHDISFEVASQLCRLGTELRFEPSQDSPSLVFPLKRSNVPGSSTSVRVSEAEARLLFSLALNKRSVPFAVEAPTVQRYSFKGSTPMSARVDVLVYTPLSDKPGGVRRHLGIEFKAHNAPPESIRKDLEKLLREDHDGLWFHVLQNINSGTLVSLFGKFRNAFQGMASACARCVGELTFVFVVTGSRLVLYRSLDCRQDPVQAFAISYRVRSDEVRVSDSNGWNVEAV